MLLEGILSAAVSIEVAEGWLDGLKCLTYLPMQSMDTQGSDHQTVTEPAASKM